MNEPIQDPWEAALAHVQVEPVDLTDAAQRLIATSTNIKSERTVRAYTLLVRMFSEFLGRPATTADLTEENVGGWFRHRGTQVARNTVNGEASTLLALWRWAALRNLAPPVTIKAPPRQEAQPKALTIEQLRALFATAERTAQVLDDVPGDRYWPALLVLLWQTAERIGAVRALRWEDIDLEGGWVRYPASTRKFSAHELVRPISPAAISRLEALREVSPDAPFAAGVGNAWYALWHCLTAEAGLPRWVTPHTVRKCVASHLPSLDDACEMLGHSSSKVTKRHYRDPTIGDGRKLLDKLPKITKPQGLLGRLLFRRGK